MTPWAVLTLLMVTVLTGKGSEAQDCGVAPQNTRIVGGEDAPAGSWPWEVSMHINFAQFHVCGGTLISDQWVLTAASCIIFNFPSVWILYFGRETQSGPNVHEVNRTVSQIIIHPEYKSSGFNNDIALMKLSSPVNFTDYIRPVCLASNSSQFHNSTLCWSTGWGRNESNGPPHDQLQEVKIPVIGEKQCSCSYRPLVNITEEMICAGQENKGLCNGDGGGPLQCKQASVWIQAGISSFGTDPCAHADFPSVFARVSQFQSWIMDQVGGANVGFATFTSSGTDQDDSFVCASATTAASAVAAELTFAGILVTVSLLYTAAP